MDQFSGLQPDEQHVIITSDDFSGIDSSDIIDERGGTVRLLVEHTQGKIDWNLVWVRHPTNYAHVSTYGTYGNEPEIENCYVAGAIVVVVPAAGEGVRAVVGV